MNMRKIKKISLNFVLLLILYYMIRSSVRMTLSSTIDIEIDDCLRALDGYIFLVYTIDAYVIVVLNR